MEIQEMITRGGWRKDTIDGLHLHDSFLRESMRLRALRQRKFLPRYIRQYNIT